MSLENKCSICSRRQARKMYKTYLQVVEDVSADCRLTARDELEISKHLGNNSRKEYLNAMMDVQDSGEERTRILPPQKKRPGVQIPINETADEEARNLTSGRWWHVFLGVARDTAVEQQDLFEAVGPSIPPGSPEAKEIVEICFPVDVQVLPELKDGELVHECLDGEEVAQNSEVP